MSLASEISLLLQSLLSSPKWSKPIADEIISSLQAIPSIILGLDDDAPPRASSSSSQSQGASATEENIPKETRTAPKEFPRKEGKRYSREYMGIVRACSAFSILGIPSCTFAFPDCSFCLERRLLTKIRRKD